MENLDDQKKDEDITGATDETKEEKDIVSDVTNEYLNWQRSTNTQRNKWDKFYKLYRSYRERKKYDFRANLFIPYSFGLIETEMPRLISALFAVDPFLEVQSRSADKLDNAKIVEKLIDYQMTEKMNILPKTVDLIKECLIYGTAIAKIFWRYDKKNIKMKKKVQVPIIDEISGLPNGFQEQDVVSTEEVVTYDDPDIQIVDIYDFAYDTTATCIDDASWVIHRTIVDLDYLKDLTEHTNDQGDKIGVYKNIDKVEVDCDNKTNDSDRGKRLQSIGLDDIYFNKDLKTKRVELLEEWSGNRVRVVANRKWVIRDEESPFWHGMKPFIEVKDHPVQHEFYGVGELEPIESLQREANDLRNQRMDNVNLILNRMAVVKRGAGIDKSKIISQPGGILETNDMNGFRWEAPPDVTNSSYEEVKELKSDIQEATGASSYIRGMATEGQTRTASGINLMQSAASARFNLKVRLIEAMFIEKMARMILALDQQYMDKAKVVRIVGDKGATFVNVTPDEIQGNYDFMPTGSIMLTNREVKFQQYLTLKKVFGQDPTVNQYNLNKMILKASGERNIEDILLKSPEEIQQQAQQMQQAKAGGQVDKSPEKPGGDMGTKPPAPPQGQGSPLPQGGKI